MPLGSTYHKKSFIVNEVLCFVQNKINSEPKETIVNLGSSFYTAGEIKSAKQLLYESVPVANRRLKHHRGENKAKMDFEDNFYHFYSIQLTGTVGIIGSTS